MEPDGQDHASTLLKVVSKPIPEHAEIQKLRNWKEPRSEETTTMISNDVLRDFHTSMMSGGLFDDENEDSEVFGSRQSANIWSHPTRTYDASADTGTRTEKHEKERSVNDNDDFLVSEPDKQKFELKALSSPKKPSLLHADERFPERSYAHVHESLFANESTSSLGLKDTLSFLRKGSFEDDEDEPENMDLFGPSNGNTSLKEIDGTNSGDIVGNFKGMGSSSKSSVDAKANLVDEISERAGVASFDFGKETAASTETGLVIKQADTGSTNNNIESLSRGESTLSSLESLSETRRTLEEVSSVYVAQVLTHEKSNSERMHGYADNRNRLLNMKPTHILDEERVLNAKSDDDVASWSSESSTIDTCNLGENNVANGFKPEEPHKQTGNLEVLAEHPTHQVEEVTNSSHSEFQNSMVKHQYEDESWKASTNIVEPPVANLNSSSEKTNEERQNSSSNWSRKLTLLQEHLNLQPTMFSPQQRSILNTQSNIIIDDALEENKIFTPQTQRPSLQATSQGINSLHHVTMSRPRGPKRRAPTSTPPLLVTNTQVVGNSPEEWAGDPSPHFVVHESDSIEKTEAFSRTNDTMLHSTFENTNISSLSNKGVAEDTLSVSEGFTKSSKKNTPMGFADKSKAQKSQVGPSNTILFEDEDGENGLFGPSSTSPLLESKLSQVLSGSDKGSAFTRGPEAAYGKVPAQTLKHQLSPRECFRRSLFDDDDEDDDTSLFS